MPVDPKGEKKPDSPGNAMDALTPPTMKYANAQQPDSEKTQIGPAPGSSHPPTSKQGRSSPTIAGHGHAGRSPESSITDLPMQDLSSERLLRDAPRVENNGRTCPALNGIPLLAKIGQGGMGAVYYGIHPRLNSEVAVKVLPFHLAEQDPGMVKRFFREAQIAAQVRSPHLVNVMDVNEDSGLFFLVMEFVPGSTAGHLLKAMVEKGQTGLSELETLDIAIGACEGLHAAHSQGIVHRDLKPENIMVPYLSRHDKTKYDLKNSKLMDLGLARNEDSNSQSLTGVQAAMGTPGYMAPEQALDAKTADKRSDVFGMGATLYALLAGRAPFRGEAVMKVLMATMHEPHEPISKVRTDISPTLQEIVDKCLDKKQENRFNDAQQLMRALKNCRRLLAPTRESEDDDGDGGDGGEAPMMSTPRNMGATMRTAVPSSDATLVGPGNVSAELPGAGKKKGMLMVGSGVAALVLIGGGYMLMGRGGGGPDFPEPTRSPLITKSEDLPKQIEDIKDLHEYLIGKANSKLVAGDIKSAQDFLKKCELEAANLPADRKETEAALAGMKDARTRVLNQIDAVKRKKEFDKRIEQVEAFIAAGDLDKALSEAKEAKKSVGTDLDAKSLADKKMKSVVDLIDSREARSRFDKLLVDADKLEKENQIEKALEKIGEARAVLRESEDAALRERRLKAVMEQRGKAARYDSLMLEVVEAEKIKLYEKALNTALDAVELRADNKSAKDAIERIQGIIGKAKQDEIALKKKLEEDARLTNLLSEGNKFAIESEWDKASEKLAVAMDLRPADARVVKLKKVIDEGLDAARKAKEEGLRKVKFNEAAEEVASALKRDDSDTGMLRKNIERLKGIDAKEARISDFEKSLQKLIDYDKHISATDAAIQAGNFNEAKTQIDLALKLIPNGPRATQVSDILVAKQDVASKAKRFGEILGEADKLAQAAEGLKNPIEQRDQYQLAINKYADARKFAPEKDTSLVQHETAVKQKLETAKAAALKLETEAKLRNDFNTKLTAADEAFKANKPEDALKFATEAKNLLKDPAAFKPELDDVTAKLGVYNKAVDARKAAAAEAAVGMAYQNVDKRLKSHNIANAIADLKAVQNTLNNAELKTLGTTLDSIMTADQSFRASVKSSRDRVQKIDQKLKDKGGEQKLKLNKLYDDLLALPDQMMDQLSANGLKKADGLKAIEDKRAGIEREMETLTKELEELSRQQPVKVKPPDTDPGLDGIRTESKKGTKGNSTKGSGAVGEQNIDD